MIGKSKLSASHVALLRGINVGGHHKLPMKELRELLGELGFSRVQTYIQSGNCVFASRLKDKAAIARRIAEAVEQRFGFRPGVFVLTLEELSAAIEVNPFDAGLQDPKSVHLFFLAASVRNPDLDGLRSYAGKNEDFALIGNILYLFAPDGIGRSRLVEKIGKHVPVEMTARNLRSVINTAGLAQRAL